VSKSLAMRRQGITVLVLTALLALMLILFLGLGSEVCFARENGRGGNGASGQNAMQNQAGSSNCGQTEADRGSSNRGNPSNRTNENRENRSNHNAGTHNNQGTSGANSSNCGNQSGSQGGRGNQTSSNNPGNNQQPGVTNSQNNQNNSGQQGNNDQSGQNNGSDCGNQPGAPAGNGLQNNSNPGQQGFNNGNSGCTQGIIGSCVENNDCHHDGNSDCQDGCNNDGCCNNYNENHHQNGRNEGCNCDCGYEDKCINVNCTDNRFECQHRRNCGCDDDCDGDCDGGCGCEQCGEHHREHFRMRCGGSDNDCDDCDGNCGDGCDCGNDDGCQQEYQYQYNHCFNWDCGNQGCQCGNGCGGCWMRHRHRHRHHCHCCCCGCPCDDDVVQDPEVYVVKDGPDMAHEGDTITYTFEVSGNCDLTEVTVVDSLLGPITVYTGDLDNDGVLDVGEIWIYTADYIITSETPDPLTNEVVVTAKYMPCHSISATDTHTLDVLHPEISIDKTVDSSSVNAGDEVVYTYVVVNEGDCTLYDVEVNDDLIGFIGKVDSLAPGASCTFTARDTLLSDTVNVGTVVAFDALGDPTGRVDASDDELVIVAAGEPEEPVEPEGPTEPEEPTNGTSTSQVSQVQAEAQQVAVSTQEDVLPYTGIDLLLYLGMGLVLLMTGLGLRRCRA